MKKSSSIENQIVENQTIVEIGPSINPIFELFSENKTFKKIGKGLRYIAIDCDKKELKKFKKLFNKKEYEAKIGDLRDLPLKSDSVDQIWLMNVFGGFQNNPKKLPDGTLQYSSGYYDIFQELSRVLKPKGKVYIGELAPPIGKGVEWLTDEDYSGFGLEKKVYKGYKEVKSFVERMGGEAIRYGLPYFGRPNSLFFIELIKK